MKRIALQLAVLVAVTLIAGTAYNFSNKDNPEKYVTWLAKRPVCEVDAPKGPPTPPDPPQPPGPERNGEVEPEPPVPPPPPEIFRFIEHDEVLEYYGDGITLFIDARRTREYVAGHITGAIPISVWEADMEQKVSELAANPDVNLEAPVIIYCTKSDDCKDSQDLARFLHEAGFLNLMVYSGGYPEWEKKQPDDTTAGSDPGEK